MVTRLALKTCQACGYRPFHTRPCQICGVPIEVSPSDSVVTCPSCGAEYEVLVHGSVSPTRGLTAEKLETYAGISLWDETYTTRIENTTQKVGTRILVVATLHAEPMYTCYADMDYLPLDIYLSIAGGAFRKIRTGYLNRTSDTGRPAGCGVDIYYTLAEAGSHRFRAEFEGTDKYAGCPLGRHAKLRAR